MTPELRNWYLSNLGIVQYVPRGEEPVTLSFHSHEAQEVNQLKTPGQIKTPSRNEHMASVLEVVQGKSEKPSSSFKVEIEQSRSDEKTALPDNSLSSGHLGTDSSTRETTSTNPPLNFRLACWHPSDDLLVFNELPVGVNPDVEQNQLLGNILKAIGRLSGSLPSPELIDWPMGNHLGNVPGDISNSDESSAREMLSVFLDARIKKHGVLWVLLMGELPTKFLSPQDVSYDDQLGAVAEIAGGARIMVIRSLQEMLQESAHKASTWQTIQCLTHNV